MNARVLILAERVIRQTDRDHPADAELRLELNRQRGLLPAETAGVTRAVFGYFRWRGWLAPRQTLSDQIRQSCEMAETFARSPGEFSDTELVEHVVPLWLHREIEVTPEFARALQGEPRLWLRARPGQGMALANQLGDCQKLGEGPLADTLSYHGRADLFRTPAFHQGEFELQDISSQAVGLVCGPVPGETWWDACAGEGGKLLHLSDLMGNKGLVWATDRAEWRLRRLKRRAARARVFNYRAAVWDGGSKLPTKTKFDGILVDAPCSGTGTWQRNPHARWTLTTGDLEELRELQIHLLTQSAASLKPGGKLVYSVCSLARSETLGVVTRFEERCPELRRLSIGNPLAALAEPAESILLRPQEFGGNGMFIAAWRGGQPR